jgi:hypothetical protein
VHAWLDLQETSYCFGYGSLRSLAGLVLHLAESLPFASSLSVGISASDMALAIIILNIRRGSSSPSSGCRGSSLISVTDLPLCCAWVWGGTSATLHFHPNYGSIPMAATAMMGSWHGGDGSEVNSCNFRRQRLSLPLVSSSRAVDFSLQLQNINSSLQSVYVHAVLGGGAPRWHPLNSADRHALLARFQLERVLAGGNGDGGIQL